jgi:hypothetical protein
VFANVTVDAKLQVWDLSVSSIDPVVVVDTSLDDVVGCSLLLLLVFYYVVLRNVCYFFVAMCKSCFDFLCCRWC